MTKAQILKYLKEGELNIQNANASLLAADLVFSNYVAREMKKPCIIGTKIATKVLKDGDLVEVDANNGVVRIIKK